MYTERQMSTYASGEACDRIEREIATMASRIEKLEDALRDCLFLLEVDMARKGVPTGDATAESAIGKARAVLG